MQTKDRILTTARNLFNMEGTAQVSTNHIAEAAEISPGNLYYHFRNKEEIIRAICDQLFTLTGEMFTLDEDRYPTLEDVQRWVHENFVVTWQYAFVYRELPALIRHDPELAVKYAAVRQRGYDGFFELIAVLQTAGVLLPTLDNVTVVRLADLLWLISESWLTSLELQGQPATDDQMQRGIDLMLLVLQPYLS
ncbi:MAG: DNA-binding transcriptional regulator, AcrR family [Chloroflexi bacterium AL-W]|nr:DNA-binding transcriptional regulator, AcrR family [Chloroflexi bacterium AL-N1]NOK69263.1 DNA-binding transcriptional regulator, AcrR family [Chloroflexi bacterium AL-N10]NOK76324.1 DNA-binding transcriptional regulator, AcrR family [Chloroflexi bacterium AL-N5]NOK83441.1 DNA-binding transcriptional regulator, AcrR family [Chloroflexi bacterium AL-W]NOK91101.1 DNA-binding transcriptional regulator, AcrR family [Chloroflexi bacterium AL-N15]